MTTLNSILMRFTPEAKTHFKGIDYNFVVPMPPLLPGVNDIVLLPGLESFEFVVVRRFWEFGEGALVVALLLDINCKAKKLPELRSV
jgi:hypothetical protein